ncbi:hypothetical protein QBC44DRAFT_386676 [Cladorrhinum sp. PSN332]|nr:hypothetical protein QBC44DRAFT_386676 [Cladorrhinum sp. PSN332]
MRRSDDLPEAVRDPQQPSTLPEVVPELDSTPQHISDHDLSPQQRQAQAERDKYPAYYDVAPMIPYEAAATNPDYGQPLPIPYYPGPGTPATAHNIMSPGSSVPWDPILPAGDGTPMIEDDEKNQPRYICGLKKKTFIIAVVLALLVVIAAVVGGVVGAIKSKSSGSNSDNNTSKPGESQLPITTTSSSSSSSSGSPSTTATSPATPTPTKDPLLNLANQTAPGGIAFQAYSGLDFSGEMSPIFRIEGYYDLDFPAESYIWLPNGTSECCVTFCANATSATGWWCDERRRPEGTDIFRRVQIWCGRTNEKVKGVKKKECSPPGGSTSTSTVVSAARTT